MAIDTSDRPEPAHRLPAPEVEFVRDWFTPAYRAWARAMYPRDRRTFWIAGGCLLWFVVLPFIAIKAFIFWGVVVTMIVLLGITGLIDMATYYWRRKAAV